MSEAQKKEIDKSFHCTDISEYILLWTIENAFRTLRSRCCIIANERT